MTTELALALNNLTAAVTHYGKAVEFFTFTITVAVICCCCAIIYIARNARL